MEMGQSVGPERGEFTAGYWMLGVADGGGAGAAEFLTGLGSGADEGRYGWDSLPRSAACGNHFAVISGASTRELTHRK